MNDVPTRIINSGPEHPVQILLTTTILTALLWLATGIVAAIIGSILSDVLVYTVFVFSVLVVGVTGWIGTAWSRTAGLSNLPAVLCGTSGQTLLILVYWFTAGLRGAQTVSIGMLFALAVGCVVGLRHRQAVT